MEQICADKQSDDLPIGAMFHENIASGWSSGYSGGSFSRRRSFFRPILDRNVVAGQRWIDLGCGSGILTKELLARGASVVAIDGSPNMLREAQKNVQAADGTMLTWLRLDVERLVGVADESSDGILCSSVIEYVQAPDALLQEAYRVLCPGGKLIMSVPPKLSFVRTVQKTIRQVAALFGFERFSYLSVSKFEVGSKEISHKLRQIGFEVDYISSFDPTLPKFALTFLRPALLIVEVHKDSHW